MGSLNSAVGAQMSTMMHRVARRVKLAQAASENRFTDAMEKNKNDLVVAQTALKEDQKASESRIAESQKASENRFLVAQTALKEDQKASENRIAESQKASENRLAEVLKAAVERLSDEAKAVVERFLVAQTALKEDQKASESRIAESQKASENRLAESQKASESRWVAYESRMQAFIAVNNWKFIVYCLSAAVAIFGTIFGGVAALLHWLGIDIVAPRRAVDHVKGSKGGGEGGVPRPAVS